MGVGKYYFTHAQCYLRMREMGEPPTESEAVGLTQNLLRMRLGASTASWLSVLQIYSFNIVKC